MVSISSKINYLKFTTIKISIWNHRGDIIFHAAIKYEYNIYKQEVIISSISLPFIIENQSRGIPQNQLNQNQKPKKNFLHGWNNYLNIRHFPCSPLWIHVLRSDWLEQDKLHLWCNTLSCINMLHLLHHNPCQLISLIRQV